MNTQNCFINNNVYYDNDTERAPIFEKNLLKDGFKIKQWNDELNG